MGDPAFFLENLADALMKVSGGGGFGTGHGNVLQFHIEPRRTANRAASSATDTADA